MPLPESAFNDDGSKTRQPLFPSSSVVNQSQNTDSEQTQNTRLGDWLKRNCIKGIDRYAEVGDRSGQLVNGHKMSWWRRTRSDI